MKLTYNNQKMIEEQERLLTKKLEESRTEVLKRASVIAKEKLNTQMFHGKIGNRNNILVDSVRLRFPNASDFLAQWLNGLLTKVKCIEENQKQKYNGKVFRNTASHELLKFMKDELISNCVIDFLARNFYREFIARTREKPNEVLWSLWFGENKLTWGLIIAPSYRDSNWTNKKSEIIRADYSYWTIGHLLKTGLINPESDKPQTFPSSNQFIDFYRNVLKRLLNRTYEQEIAERYIQYLQKSSDIYDEPFLIPELRYGGLDQKHKYRLDFAVFNSHVMKFTGFELSPASTHQSISGSQSKTQQKINEDLSKQWKKEMQKRNEYFNDFGIFIETFTDDDLQNLDSCFIRIENCLKQRPNIRISLSEMISEVKNYPIG